MRIDKFDYNDIEELYANTYVVSDNLGNAIIIDPSKDDDSLVNFVKKNNFTLKAILLTHGHYDHLRGVNKLLETFDVPLYISEEDKEFLINPYLNLSISEDEPITVSKTPLIVKDNDELNLLNEEVIKVITTPFHTSGSVCYYFINNKYLFSGDTLFKLSIGRDDLPGALPFKRRESLNKLKALPKEAKIYPGHGSNSVLDIELKLNRFLQ